MARTVPGEESSWSKAKETAFDISRLVKTPGRVGFRHHSGTPPIIIWRASYTVGGFFAQPFFFDNFLSIEMLVFLRVEIADVATRVAPCVDCTDH